MSSRIYTQRFMMIFVFINASVLLLITYIQNNIPLNYNESILQYQKQKLSKNKTIETLILGDSSSGNAIDFKLFSKLINSKTLNFSLTGDFGIYSSKVLLQNALLNFQNLKQVIIMFTPEIWSHPFLEDALYLMRRENLDFPKISYSDYIQWYYNPKKISWYLSLRQNKLRQYVTQVNTTSDYLNQNPNRMGQIYPHYHTALSAIIQKSHLIYLQQLSQLCSSTRITCHFIHGPMFTSKLKASESMLNEVMKVVRSTASHITFINHFTAIPKHAIGDTYNHVHPRYKAYYTQLYASIYNKYR